MYLRVVLTGCILSASPSWVQKIISLFKPAINCIRKWGDAADRKASVPARVTERCGVLKGRVHVTQRSLLLCKYSQALIPLLKIKILFSNMAPGIFLFFNWFFFLHYLHKRNVQIFIFFGNILHSHKVGLTSKNINKSQCWDSITVRFLKYIFNLFLFRQRRKIPLSISFFSII